MSTAEICNVWLWQKSDEQTNRQADRENANLSDTTNATGGSAISVQGQMSKKSKRLLMLISAPCHHQRTKQQLHLPVDQDFIIRAVILQLIHFYPRGRLADCPLDQSWGSGHIWHQDSPFWWVFCFSAIGLGGAGDVREPGFRRSCFACAIAEMGKLNNWEFNCCSGLSRSIGCYARESSVVLGGGDVYI